MGYVIPPVFTPSGGTIWGCSLPFLDHRSLSSDVFTGLLGGVIGCGVVLAVFGLGRGVPAGRQNASIVVEVSGLDAVLLIFLVVLAVCCVFNFGWSGADLKSVKSALRECKYNDTLRKDQANDLYDRINRIDAKLEDKHIALSHQIDAYSERAFGAIDGLTERVSALEAPPAPPKPGHGLNGVIDAAMTLEPDFTVVIYRGDREVCSIRDGRAVGLKDD